MSNWGVYAIFRGYQDQYAHLPPAETCEHCLPGIHEKLFSMATAVDAWLSAHFFNMHCTFKEGHNEILWGWRDYKNKLWHIEMSPIGNRILVYNHTQFTALMIATIQNS